LKLCYAQDLFPKIIYRWIHIKWTSHTVKHFEKSICRLIDTFLKKLISIFMIC
jgi:hypothetical protein